MGGWTESQYGQYYLYSNVFDDTNGIFKGATDATNLGTIALLGGLGGGLGGGYGPPSGYYPSYGAPVAPEQGRKRRDTVEKECRAGDQSCTRRKRREKCGDDEVCQRKRR